MPFDEDFDTETAPDAEGSYGFDYDTVFRNLDGPESEQQADIRGDLALVLRRIIQWLIPPKSLTQKRAAEYIGRRTIVLAWVINPAYFTSERHEESVQTKGSSSSISLTAIADEIGITPQLLHQLSGEVTREFGITNRAQDHAWNRKDKDVKQ